MDVQGGTSAERKTSTIELSPLAWKLRLKGMLAPYELESHTVFPLSSPHLHHDPIMAVQTGLGLFLPTRGSYGVGRMRKLLFAFVVGGLLGTGVGVALGFFFFPFVFPPPAATDALSTNERNTATARGEFIHANPADPIHWGRGRVTVTPRTVFLEDDFEVGPGPAFHVYLVPRKEVRQSADVAGSMFVDLGPLRAFKGSQRYSIPSGVDVTRFASVVIWCREFSVLISPADLQAGAQEWSAASELAGSSTR